MATMRGGWTGAVWVAILAFPLLASAQATAPTPVAVSTLRDFMHARSYGMGGAFRATGLGADSVVGNPASMSLFPRFQTELSGAWELDGRMTFGTLAVVDSVSNRVAAGLAYHFGQIREGEERRTLHLQTFAFAVPVAPWLHFGLSGRYLNLSGSKDKGAAGPRAANAITGDAGLMFRFGQSIQVGVSGHNLIETTHPELARYFVGSAAFVGQLFSAAAEVRADFGARRLTDPVDAAPANFFGWSVGAEYILGVVPLRAGYQSDPLANAQYLSGGLGLMTETGNIDLAYRHQLDGEAKLFTIAVRLGN